MPGQAAWAVTETAATAISRLKTPATRVVALLYLRIEALIRATMEKDAVCACFSSPHPVYASLFFHDNDRRWKTAGGLGVNRLLLMLLLRLGPR